MGLARWRGGVAWVALAAVGLLPAVADARASKSSKRVARARAAVARPAEPRALVESPPLRPEVLDLALRAYRCAASRGEVLRPSLAVIDYSLPSTERRLWLVDTETGRVLRQELVAHGRGSGDVRAESFSNEHASYQTSLGLFVGRNVYHGEHGLSLRLAGLEPGINDRAFDRAIVMHGAWYVGEDHVARWGRLGRSLGCPALAPEVTAAVIDRLRDGAALFAYAADENFLRRSAYLSCDPAALPTRVAAAAVPAPAPPPASN